MATAKNLDINCRAKLDGLQKLSKQGQQTFSSLTAGAKSTASAFKDLATTAAGVFSGQAIFSGLQGLASGFKSLTADVFNNILNQESLAAILQVSGNTLRAFTLAAERATLGQSELEAALLKTAKNVKEQDSTLDGLGLSFEKLEALSVDQQFLAILEALEKIPNANKRVQLAMEIWGRSGAQILQASSKGFRQAELDIRKFGLAIDADGLTAIDRFHVSITDLWARIKGLSSQILAGLSDTLGAWLEQMGTAWDKIGSVEMAQKVLNVFQKIRDGVLDAVESIINAFGGTKKALLEMAQTALSTQAFWTAATLPFGDPKANFKALQDMETAIHNIKLELASLPNTQFKFPSSLRSPLNAHAPAGGAVPNQSAPDVARAVGGPVLIATLPAAEIEKVVKAIPQSFGPVKQGSVEAARAIFEASKAVAEGKAAEEERRHKELLEAEQDTARAVREGNDLAAQGAW